MTQTLIEELEDKLNDIYLLMRDSPWINDEASNLKKIKPGGSKGITVNFRDGGQVILYAILSKRGEDD